MHLDERRMTDDEGRTTNDERRATEDKLELTFVLRRKARSTESSSVY
jgi:hypothetical protein